MAKIVENLCKSLRESWWESCEEKSGKKLNIKNMVDKGSFPYRFTNIFHVVLNNIFTTVKCGVFHVFHIAYYYNY